MQDIKNIHFIGIGGIGISAIARMMLGEGKKVTGQDIQDSEIIKELRKNGADITIGQSFDNIPENTDLVVYTIAIKDYDPEFFEKLKNSDFEIKSYPEMLNEISKNKYTIAVAGTHGKTTTTAMLAKILEEKDPTVVVGSLISNKSNFIKGKSDLFIVEACEYRRSFLNLDPNILVITNIDKDHLDYYKDLDDIKNAFRELAMKTSEYVVCDLSKVADVVAGLDVEIIDYRKYYDKDLKLKIPGKHNKENAAVALAVADILNVKNNSLLEFSGIWRRFEYKGEVLNGAKLYDDYAHHPVEIKATLEGFRELYPESKIVVVFQPHLFSRTKMLFDDFVNSFELADQILILPIYYAREESDGTISSSKLAVEIDNAEAFKDFDSAEEKLRNMDLNKNTIIVTMGAGEAFKIGDNLMI
ncbi:MAG: Mur ligase family protein [Patescibacteria group bacterium]|nr:Mur ligase family protein [Patescibacteria group bacterium]